MEDSLIKLNGSLYQICRQLESYGIFLDEKETDYLVRIILKNKNHLQTDEIVNSRVRYPDLPDGYLGLMILDYNYYISIKKLSLCGIALIADKLSYGLTDKILSALGVSFKAIAQVNEYNGEKCIVKETILFHDKLGNTDILEKFKGNCCNNDLNCSYREDGKCKCTKDNIKSIYENLTARGVFKKLNSGYKLNW